MKNLTLLPAVIAGAALCHGHVSGEVILEYSGMAAYEAMHYTFVEDASVEWNAETRTANHFGFAGRIFFNGGAIDGFCVELAQEVSSGPELYEVQGLQGPPTGFGVSALMVGSLFDQYYDDVVASDSNAMAAAFQVMIWELTHENFTDGVVSIAQISLELGAAQFADLSSEATAFFGEMRESLVYDDDFSDVNIFLNESYQDFINVPSPGALTVLWLGGLIRRRRRA
jgi:hypothetical protein